MPMPLADLTRVQLTEWVKLYDHLVKTTPRIVGERKTVSPALFPQDSDDDLDGLLNELNRMVSDCLHLEERDRALVSDLVHVRLELNDGKVGEPAVGLPEPKVLRTYSRRLKRDLDAYLGDEGESKHKIDVVYDRHSGMIQIDLVKHLKPNAAVSVFGADEATAKQLAKTRNNLREEAAQWVYFDRDLKIYSGTKTFLFKPMQRFHWTESQAMIDANEIIAETLCAEGELA